VFKRATWVSVGFGLGVGTTVATAYQVRKKVNRYQPNALANRVADSLVAMRDEVTAALAEGRSAARDRERELRSRRR